MALPYSLFFDPTPEFIAWLKDYTKNRVIIDCGAGVGRLGSLMAGSVLSIDIHEREETESAVILADATKFDFPEGAVVIFARPCHGSWVGKAAGRALNRGATVLYIGLQKNLIVDLPDLGAPQKEVFVDAGEAGEVVIEIKPFGSKTSPNLPTFVLKQDYMGNYWWEDGGAFWINSAGGRCHKSKNDVILQTVQSAFEDLDWTITSYVEPDSKTGWLSPDGKYWGCSTQNHRSVADLVLKSSSEKLLDQGWVKVNGINAPGGAFCDFFNEKPLNDIQRKFLIDNGYHGYELEEEPLTGDATSTHPGLALRKLDKKYQY